MRRVYRAKNSVKAFWFVFLAISVCFGIGIFRGISNSQNTWLDLAIAIVLVVAGSVGAIQTFTVRVVLSDDSIAQGSIFRSQSMRLDKTLYRREYMEYHDGPEGGTNVYYLELVSRYSDIQSLKIAKDDFDFDRIFWDCVHQIPDIERLYPPS